MPRARVRSMDAAWLLVAAMALVLWPRAEPPPRSCPRPAEAGAVGGWTDRVSCEGGSSIRGPARLLFGGRLDLNCSPVEALEVLPGIGPARAEAIVAERCRRPFAAPGDVVRVAGIGPHTAAGIAPWVETGPPVDSPDFSVACRRSCDEDAKGAR